VSWPVGCSPQEERRWRLSKKPGPRGIIRGPFRIQSRGRPPTRVSLPSSNRGSQMTEDDLKAELERVKAENNRLKSERGRSVSLKVSEKGGVSVYGLGRFPVTLYKEQWTKLLTMADDIRAFIKEHDGELKAKPQA
jgi:hypothetical protein